MAPFSISLFTVWTSVKVQHSEGNIFQFSKLILNIFYTKQSYVVNNEETETRKLLNWCDLFLQKRASTFEM